LFARKPKYSITFFLEKEVHTTFFLPLSMQAFNQLNSLQNLLKQRHFDSDSEDQWIYKWGSGKFSSKKAYREIVGTQEASPLFKWL
jgi:hypothetical protein